MGSLRLKIPPFEKARTVLEALKDQEQARRKKVGNTWCFCRLSKGQVASRHHTRDLFACGPAGHLSRTLESQELLASRAGSWTELRSIPDSGLGSAAVEVVQFASSPQSGLSCLPCSRSASGLAGHKAQVQVCCFGLVPAQGSGPVSVHVWFLALVGQNIVTRPL